MQAVLAINLSAHLCLWLNAFDPVDDRTGKNYRAVDDPRIFQCAFLQTGLRRLLIQGLPCFRGRSLTTACCRGKNAGYQNASHALPFVKTAAKRSRVALPRFIYFIADDALL